MGNNIKVNSNVNYDEFNLDFDQYAKNINIFQDHISRLASGWMEQCDQRPWQRNSDLVRIVQPDEQLGDLKKPTLIKEVKKRKYKDRFNRAKKICME